MIDAKMKDMAIAELEKLGIAKEQVDDYMIWGIKKLMLGVMKIKWSLKENGVEGKEADEKLQKIVDKVVAMDADELHKMMHEDGGDDNWHDKKSDCDCNDESG